MTVLVVGKGDSRRGVARLPSVKLKNRFFEYNPILEETESALISRPGLKKWLEIGDGPIYKVYSEPGTFNDDLFVVSSNVLYRVSSDDATITELGELNSNLSNVEFAAAATIGDTPERLFIADGQYLWVYNDEGTAVATLTFSNTANVNDVIQINDVYYKFVSGVLADADGTVSDPWQVQQAGDLQTQLLALYHAIRGSGGRPGFDYSENIEENPYVVPYGYTNPELKVAAKVYGEDGITSIAIAETGANMSWSGAYLEDATTPLLRRVATPDEVGVISVAHINQYIIVIPAQGEGKNGKFYWIQPGETEIDPLDFATAERSPDAINQVVVFSNMFWLCGQSTTEPWIVVGDIDTPMQPFKGLLYDRGALEGCAVKVKDGLVIIDPNGSVFFIKEGIKLISRPDIAERIRLAIEAAEDLT